MSSGRRRSGASWTNRWAGLRNQAGQLQLQTRLRSMCRRATSAMRELGWAAVTRPLCHGYCRVTPPAQISPHSEQNYLANLGNPAYKTEKPLRAWPRRV
ncbi:hypothetical protein B5M45_03120 [Mycobacterium simiae]|uniref:Uncharacterized protein n=1 Tax=Mycobacterium simiae TaxID=1784 RepID=A0A1X0YGD9_MYCSI|nr:hypothetical protein B5M45_03120 [Mycobacterium simiae]